MMAHRTSWLGPRGVALAALLAAGCSLDATPRTGLAEQKKLTVVGEELRIRVRAGVGPFVGTIEEAADAAARRCPDPAIRARSIEWKLAAVPQAQDALLQADPTVALVDAWAYALQMQKLLESPAGRAELGDCAPAAAAAMGTLVARGRRIAEELAPGRGENISRMLESWVDDHPLRALHLTRTTVVPMLASATARKELGALQAAGTMVETLDDLTARIAVYRESLLKEARWTAELAAMQAEGSDLAAQIARDAARLSVSAERLGQLAAALPALLARERSAAVDALRAERVAVLADIERQRAETLAMLQSERAVVLDRVDGMSRAAIDQAGERAEQVVDRVFLRIGQIAVALLVAAVLLFLVVTRALGARNRRHVAGARP